MAPRAAAGADVLRTLGLDDGFIHRVLLEARQGPPVRGGAGDDEEDGPVNPEGAAALDYDVYLMEKGVMPLLLQGLDALSRHMDKRGSGGVENTGSKAPFNPLTWLAQYLLRNHPGKVKDGRTKMYERLAELAAIERGRRNLLRKKTEIEDLWLHMSQERPLFHTDVVVLVKHLDEGWNLDGLFVQQFPVDLVMSIPPADGHLSFDNFWSWFEVHVRSHDVLRASAFELAIKRREDAIRRAQEQEVLREHHAVALQENIEVRRGLEDQFSSLSADLYTNEVITQIINKGAVISGPQEHDGGLSLTGDHIELIVAMLRLWGHPANSVAGDVWDEAAHLAWTQWLHENGPKRCQPQVDSTNLRHLMDRDAFQAYLGVAHPFPELDIDEGEAQRTVQVQGLFVGEGDDAGMFYVEALDEATGQKKQLLLPANCIEEVQQRLADGSGAPLLARIDLITQRLTSLLPRDQPA